MLGVLVGPLPFMLGPRVRELEVQAFDGDARVLHQHARSVFRDHAVEQVRLDLELPREVELTGLEHGPRRRGRVTPALDLDGGEEGLVRLAVVLVDDVRRAIVRREALDHVGAGADGVQREGVVRLRTGLEDVLRIDEAGRGTGERIEPEGVGFDEVDRHRQVIDNLGALDRGKDTLVDGVVGRVFHPFGRECDVSGGERRAIAPDHIG